MQVAEERGFVLPNLHTQQIDKPRSKESAETRSGRRRRRRRLRRICWGGGFMTGVFAVGSEGWSFCLFLFPLSPPSSSSPRPAGTAGPTATRERGWKKILGWWCRKAVWMPSEDGGAIVKLCLACARRRAALALPGARAQRGGCASPGRTRAGLPRARRRARPRAPRARTELYARRRARGSERAARPLRLPELRLLNARAGVWARESEGSGGEAGKRGQRGGRRGGAAGGRGVSAELQPGLRCACTSRLLKTKHVPKAVFSASGRFWQPQFPPLGLATTHCQRNSVGGQAKGVPTTGRRLLRAGK